MTQLEKIFEVLTGQFTFFREENDKSFTTKIAWDDNGNCLMYFVDKDNHYPSFHIIGPSEEQQEAEHIMIDSKSSGFRFEAKF